MKQTRKASVHWIHRGWVLLLLALLGCQTVPGQEIASPVPPSPTAPEPPVTATLPPTETPTETPRPSATTAPSATPTATREPSATAVPVPARFEETFDEGLSPFWQVVEGEPVIEDGELVGPVTLAVGDGTWTDYQIEVVFSRLGEEFNFIDMRGGVVLCIRFEDGYWLYIDEKGLRYGIYGSGFNIRLPSIVAQIAVEGNQFSHTVGAARYSMTLDGYERGGIIFKIQEGSRVDRITVQRTEGD